MRQKFTNNYGNLSFFIEKSSFMVYNDIVIRQVKKEVENMRLKNNYTWLKHADFILIDLLCLIASFVTAYYWKFNTFNIFGRGNWGALFIIVCAVNLIVTFFSNPYSGALRRRYYEQFIRELPLLFYQVVTICIMFYALKIGTLFSREMMFTMYFLYFFSSHFFKYCRKRIVISKKYEFKKRKILVVGDKDSIEEVVHNILVGDIIEHEIKYIYLIDNDGKTKIKNISVVKNYKNKDIEEVFIATNPALVPKEVYKYFIDNGICITMNIESIFGVETENAYVQMVGNYKGLSVDLFTYDANKVGYFFLKRCFDIFCSLIGLVLMLPIALVIKISYMLSGDFKSIFYTQPRIGKNGKKINIYKFRSMVHNADEVLKELLKDEKRKKEWDENQKFEDDPRITKVGKIIRKLSIDEVPQFINVLKGDMALIGPRPLIEGELESHNGLALYNKVKPGITGWWACNGRSNIEYRERLELEYYYVKNCSMTLDIICIFRTILCVLKRDGAV